jgi:hypothetical protein
MKFFIVTCIKEHRKTVYQLFKKAEINAFSSTNVTGFKDKHNSNPLAEWFAHGDEQCDSEMIFSFTADANARKAMELIQTYNDENSTGFPIRAFIVPVEASNYLI